MSPGSRALGLALVAAALPVGALAFAALVGVGLERDVPGAVAAAVALASLGLSALGAARLLGGRLPALALALGGAAAAVLALLPHYAPGERAPAVASGLRWLGASDALVETSLAWLPLFGAAREPASAPPAAIVPVDRDEPPAGIPAEALRVETRAPAPPDAWRDVDEWVQLRRAGDHMLVTAHLESHHGADDVEFVLDTGAAITTLTRPAAEAVELELATDSPVIRLNGVGGRSEARLTVVERLWLGKESVGPLTVAVCDDCLPSRSDGLLGIDVLGHFATEIDTEGLRLALRRSAQSPPPQLVTPFLQVDARLEQRRSGELGGEVSVRSVAPVDVVGVLLQLECPGEPFELGVERVPAHGEARIQVALPWGTVCPEFRVGVEAAHWD